MINSTHTELLNQLYGPKGTAITAIQKYEGSHDEPLTVGTKILYLKRAISQDSQTFLVALDKLYTHRH